MVNSEIRSTPASEAAAADFGAVVDGHVMAKALGGIDLSALTGISHTGSEFGGMQIGGDMSRVSGIDGPGS